MKYSWAIIDAGGFIHLLVGPYAGGNVDATSMIGAKQKVSKGLPDKYKKAFESKEWVAHPNMKNEFYKLNIEKDYLLRIGKKTRNAEKKRMVPKLSETA